jgi:hypothetical protein
MRCLGRRRDCIIPYHNPYATSFGSWSFGRIIFCGLNQDGAGLTESRHGPNICLWARGFAIAPGRCEESTMRCLALFHIFVRHAAKKQSGIVLIGLCETSSCKQTDCCLNEVNSLHILALPWNLSCMRVSVSAWVRFPPPRRE